MQREAEAAALRLQRQEAKEARKAKRQLKLEAKKLQRSKKARTKRREVVVDEDIIEILDANESLPLPRALRPQRQRQAPAYLHDYVI